MRSPHNLGIPLSCRNMTIYDSQRINYSPSTFKIMRSSQRVNQNCMTEVAQQFFSVLKEEQQIAQDRHFLGCMVRKNVWPKSVRKSDTQPKAKLHNLSDYLINCIKHKHTVGNRFKAVRQTDNLSDIIKKNKRLTQIRADIQELHRQISYESEDPSFTTPIPTYTGQNKLQFQQTLPKLSQKRRHPVTGEQIIPSPLNSTRQFRAEHSEQKQHELVRPKNKKLQPYSREYYINKKRERTRLDRIDVGPWQISD